MSKHDRIKRIMDSLDLGFSDFYEGGNVRQLTFQSRLDIIENATELQIIEEYMNYSVFDKKGAPHPTAQIYAVDFPSDFRASVYLLLGGYYRQAILCLRNWFEIRLTGVYFGFVNRDRRCYIDWKKGKRRVPIGQDLIKKLFGRAEFHKIDKEVGGLRERLVTLYRELSTFTHGAILEQYDLQSQTDNVPRLNPQSVDLWYSFALRVFRELVFCYFLAYGRDAFLMNPKDLEALKKYLPDTYLDQLRNRGIF
jgi:hypothetical protein